MDVHLRDAGLIEGMTKRGERRAGPSIGYLDFPWCFFKCRHHNKGPDPIGCYWLEPSIFCLLAGLFMSLVSCPNASSMALVKESSKALWPVNTPPRQAFVNAPLLRVVPSNVAS